MNVKKIMTGILSAAIAFTSVAFTAYAEDPNTITYGQFLETMKANNYNYDFGGKTITLKMTNFCTNQNHNPAEEGFEDYRDKKDEAPARIQSPKAQYQLFKGVQDVVIKNLNIVADIKDGVALHLFNNNGWEGKIEAGTPFNAEFQFLNNGNLTIEGCNFDRVSVAPYHSGDRNKLVNCTDTVKGCSFKNVYDAYGVQGAYAGKVIVDNTSFDTCSGGMYVEGGKNGITMSNNNFTNMGKYCKSGKEDTRGLIQISANVEQAENSVVEITNNTSDGSTPVLRQLSSKVSEIVTGGNKFGSDSTATSTTDSLTFTEKPSQAVTAVAKIGNKEYATLAEAMIAACNMNVETRNGIPTQTSGVVIDIVADIDAQASVLARGGKVTGYGQHFVHNIDLTINGNNHIIKTGATGSKFDQPESPTISLHSTAGKFTVKNVIAPEDLVFNVSSPQDALSDCQQKKEAAAESLVVEGCKFYGSNIGSPGRVKSITYNNCEFLQAEGAQSASGSVWPLWYKLDRTTLETFNFTNNTLKAQRPVQLARMPQGLTINFNDNNVAVNNTSNIEKSAAFAIGAEQDATYTGSLNFSRNTLNCYSGLCIYDPKPENVSFKFSGEGNTLNGAKLIAYNEWSYKGNSEAAAAAQKKIDSILDNSGKGAKIGDKEYATLADAIADAKSGDTIVLLDNIKFTDTFTISTLNKITIDFNDKIIDVTEVNEGKDSIVIESGADVTFTGNGGISANKSCIANYGAKLTLNGGTYTTQHKSRGTAIFNTDNATVELNAGAKIHSTNYGVYVGGNVKCVMNGAEIISSSYQGQSGIPNKVDYFYAVRNEGNLTINDGTVIKGIQGALSCLSDTVINGGTFETYETEESTGKSYYPVHIADKTKVVIKGGNFHSYARAAVYVSDDDIGTDGATAEIEGGVFTSGKAVNVIDATPGTNSAISVSGGTFGSDVSAYAKPGFSASKKEDGSYTVGKSEIVWETMTDSGVYTVNADNFGLMRFSFKTNVDAATISKVGVKFMNAKDITAETKSATISADKNANNFYGDLTEIAPTAGTKYFATAYIIMGDTTVWSDVIECSLNVKKQFTNYGGNQ